MSWSFDIFCFHWRLLRCKNALVKWYRYMRIIGISQRISVTQFVWCPLCRLVELDWRLSTFTSLVRLLWHCIHFPLVFWSHYINVIVAGCARSIDMFTTHVESPQWGPDMTTSGLRRTGSFKRSPSGTEPLRRTTYVRSISGYGTPTFTGKCRASDRASGMT